MLDHSLAARCFNENRVNFSDRETLPEKFNLCTGPGEMSLMIDKILSKVESLEIQLVNLRDNLTRSR